VKVKVGLFIAIICLVAATMADVPRHISYQGRIVVAATGVPVPDGDYEISFKLYDDPITPISLWEELHTSLHVEDGLYFVRLGMLTPFPPGLDFSHQYWLEVVFDGTAMTPRYIFSSAPYALNIPDSIVKPLGLIIDNPDPGLTYFSNTHLSGDSIGVRINHYYDEYGAGFCGIALEVNEQDDYGRYSLARLGWLSTCSDVPWGDFTNIAVYGEVTDEGSGGVAIFGMDACGTGYGDGDYAGYFLGDVYIDGDLTVDGSSPGSCLWTEGGTAPYIYPNINTNIQVWGPDDPYAIYATTLTETANSGAIYAIQGDSHASGTPASPYAIFGNADEGSGVIGFSKMSDGVFGYSQNGDGVYGYSGYSCGVRAWSAASTFPGLLATNTGGGPAAQFDGNVEVDGDFKATAVTKITLNGCDFVGSTAGVSDCEMLYQNSAYVEVYEDSADGQACITASIPFPSSLYGSDVEIDSIRVYYQTEETADYIDVTQLRENTMAGSYTALTSSYSDYTSTSASSYKLTCGNVLTVYSKGIYLFLNIHYDADGGTVTIYGAEVYIHQP